MPATGVEEMPAPSPTVAAPPSSSWLGEAENTTDEEKKRKSDCEPMPYVFRYRGEDRANQSIERQLNLIQCERTGDGSWRLRKAPLLSNQLVELMQRSLQDLGYDSGPPDGLIGALTRGAIRRFQAQHGMSPDGLVTFILLDRLQQALLDPSQQKAN